MKHYKLIRGYGSEDYIQVDETELEKAYYAFMEKKDAVYSGGAVRGAEILAVQPDYHKAMGWNRGYKLGPDDYVELTEKGIDRSHMNFLTQTKEKVQYLISTGQQDKIGKNVDLPALASPEAKEVSEWSKSLADKMKLK